MDGWIDRQIETNRRIGGRMYRWMDGWTNKCIDEKILIESLSFTQKIEKKRKGMIATLKTPLTFYSKGRKRTRALKVRKSLKRVSFC